MSDPNDNSIPVLHEILVPGDPAQARKPAQLAEGDVPVVPPGVHPAEHAHTKRRSKAHPHAEPHSHDSADEPSFATSAGVFDRVEPAAPAEAGAIVPPDIAHDALPQAHADVDADVIAERLRGRFTGFLTGEGRGIVEARCRDALQEQSAWLVSQITREVALALETEMAGWVREAVEEEIARRAGR
ncbi:DUF2486 family protein [Paraburkholderia xenovorans]|uniref:DUF2486 family protein n=1 Tax=Paraburkholderia xenovorans TaxID=36873 RepID=UPI0038BC1E4D